MKKMSLKVKLFLILVLMALTLVVPAIQTPQQGTSVAAAAQWGTCSGDDCGCGVEAHACIEACNGDLACIQVCRCDWLRCSKACCGARPIACP
jgi:hypothetical protein